MMLFLFLVDSNTISSALEIDAGGILQMFGKMFFEFCQESGYDTILRVLGSNVREFLQVRSYCFYHLKSVAAMTQADLSFFFFTHCLYCTFCESFRVKYY